MPDTGLAARLATATTDCFLTCPPTYFDVTYVINPWMQGNVCLLTNLGA